MERKNLAAVAYTNFRSDSRVQKEAMVARDCGYNVDIYTLFDINLSDFNQFNFIKSEIHQYKGNSRIKYIFSYLKFFSFCFFNFTFFYFKKRYSIIHFHNMPNFLVFSAILPKIFGTRIILDIHDLMPELFSVKFNLNSSNLLIRALYLEERFSSYFANEIIATNKFHINRFEQNRILNKKITEIINIADDKIFYVPEKKEYENEELLIAYPSTLAKRLGIDTLIEALEILYFKKIPVKLKIFGDGEYRTELVQNIKNKNLESIIWFSDSYISLEQLSNELDLSHIGVIPLPSNKSNDIAMPVKIYEFFAKKNCVVASNLPLLKTCFQNYIQLFEPGNSEDLANKIENLYLNRNFMQQLAESGYRKFLDNTWDHQRKILTKIYNEK